ncbi:MAG: GH25 family lysozyme [Eubacteriales bacterium]|nr:GH25 family lysozyme [Eubacteriales bacterium]
MTSPEKKSRKPVSRGIRALMLGIPAAVLLFSLVVLLRASLQGHKDAAVPPPASETPAAASAALAEPSPAQPRDLRLKAFSSAADLYIVLSAPEGEALPDGSFSFSVVSPDGSVKTCPAAADGTLYLTGLDAGLYTVRLVADGAYTALPAAIEVLAPPVLPVSGNLGFQDVDGLTYYFNRNGDAVTGLRQIDGKMYYFNLYGVKAAKLGIDVSYHNKGINWPAVKAQGIDFAIIRVGYRGWESGLLWEDDRFVQNLRGAKGAGLDVGVYVYSTAVNPIEARREADLVVGMLDGIELEYPVFFDTEQSGEYPLGRADRICKADRAPIIHAFCERIRDAGYTPGVYSGLNYLKNHVAYSMFAPYTTWLANYTRYNRLPDFPYDYDMWQFTDAGHVNGIRGIVDMNVVY